jgi:hypothetical protein
VIGVEEDSPPPPQPIAKAAPAIRMSPRQAVNQTPRAIIFLLTNARGSKIIGRNIPADAPDTVSVKTTVIWYVPLGVVEDVVIVTTLDA